MHKQTPETHRIRMDTSIRRFQQLSLNSSFSHLGEVKSWDIVFSDQDLLTLILLYVPARKLLQFKCVSKQWLSIITGPRFSLMHAKLPVRATGLFVQRYTKPPLKDKVYLCPVDDNHCHHGGSSPFRIPTFAHNLFYPGRVRIVQSCHGLYLCRGRLLSDRRSFSDHYIYNPTTNQVATLPKFYDATAWSDIVLAFDPAKSPHYKVIACVTTRMRHFDIYSSETRTWRTVSVQLLISPPPNRTSITMSSGVYFDGCIHWIELNGADSLYFNVDEERTETFSGPPISSIISSSRRSLYFGESDDHLHVVEVFRFATWIDVYEMKSDHSGWFLKYQVDLAQVFKVFPHTTSSVHRSDFDHYNMFYILLLVRRDKFKEDPFLVLELPGRAIRYNLVDGSFNEIWDYAKIETSVRDLRCGTLQAWPCIESLSPV